jgi:hypothetical protein
MEPVVTQLVLNPEHDQDAACNADGQSGHVDKGISFVSQKISKGDLKIVSEHGESPYNDVLTPPREGGNGMEPDPAFGLVSALAFLDLGKFLLDITRVSIFIIKGIDVLEQPIRDSWNPALFFIHQKYSFRKDS